MGPQPPPPPPLTTVSKSTTAAPKPIVQPPSVESIRPAGALLLELIIYNGKPIKDHWAYFVRSSVLPEVGVLIHATGDVRTGFELEIRRNYDFRMTNNQPTKKVPLQWIDAKFVNERAMCNNGTHKIDNYPVCLFEQSALKVKAPEKSLKSANNAQVPVHRIVQRNCQTWIVESADQLLMDGVLQPDVVRFLNAIRQ